MRDTQQQQRDPGNGPPNLIFGAVVPLLPFCVSSGDQVYPGTPLAALWSLEEPVQPAQGIKPFTLLGYFSHCLPPQKTLIPLINGLVIGLPQSEANTVILTIVDHFSEAAHLVALPKLLTALETANLPTQHVICLHGFALDTVSDSGSQFVTHV